MKRRVYLFLLWAACYYAPEQPAADSSPETAPVSKPVVLGPVCKKSIKETEEFCALKELNQALREAFCTAKLFSIIDDVKKKGATETGCQQAQDELNKAKELWERQKKVQDCVSSRKPVSVGSLVYEFGGMIIVEKTAGAFGSNKASEGAYFVQMDYTITNQGKETVTIDTETMELVDKMGRVFKPSRNATRDLALKMDLDIFTVQLQPSIKKKMVQVFELPDEVKTGISMRIYTGELFSWEEKKFSLVCIN